MKYKRLLIQLFGRLMVFELPEKKNQQNKGIPWLVAAGVILILSVVSCTMTYGILYLVGLVVGG